MSSREERQKAQLEANQKQGEVFDAASNPSGGAFGRGGFGDPRASPSSFTNIDLSSPAGRALADAYRESGVVLDPRTNNVIFNPADLGNAEIELARAARGQAPSYQTRGTISQTFQSRVQNASGDKVKELRTQVEELNKARTIAQDRVKNKERDISDIESQIKQRGEMGIKNVDSLLVSLQGARNALANYNRDLTNIDKARSQVGQQEIKARGEVARDFFTDRFDPVKTILRESPKQATPQRSRTKALTNQPDSQFANPNFVTKRQQKEREQAREELAFSGVFNNPLGNIIPQAFAETTRTETLPDGTIKRTTTRTQRITETDTESKALTDPFGLGDFVRDYNKGQRSLAKQRQQQVIDKAKAAGAKEISILDSAGGLISTVPLARAPLEISRLGYNKEISISYTTGGITKEEKQSNYQNFKAQQKQTTDFIAEAKRQGAKTITITDATTGQVIKEAPINRAFYDISKEAKNREVLLNYEPVIPPIASRDIFGSNVITDFFDRTFELNKPKEERSSTPRTIPTPTRTAQFFGPLDIIPSNRAIGEFTAPASNFIAAYIVDPLRQGKAIAQGEEVFDQNNKKGPFNLPQPKPEYVTPLQRTALDDLLSGRPVDFTDPNQRISIYGDAALFGAGFLLGGATGKYTGKGGRAIKEPITRFMARREAQKAAQLQAQSVDSPFGVFPTKNPKVFTFEQGTEGRSPNVNPLIDQQVKIPEIGYVGPKSEAPKFKVGREGEKVDLNLIPLERGPSTATIPKGQGKADRPYGIIETGKEGITYFVESQPVKRGANIKEVGEIGFLIKGMIEGPARTRLGAKKVSSGNQPIDVFGGRITPQVRAFLQEGEKRGLVKKITDISLFPTRKGIKSKGADEFGEAFVKNRQTVGYYEIQDLGFTRKTTQTTGYNTPLGSKGGRSLLERFIGRDLGTVKNPLETATTPKGEIVQLENFFDDVFKGLRPSKKARSYDKGPFALDLGVAGGRGKAEAIRAETIQKDQDLITNSLENLIGKSKTTTKQEPLGLGLPPTEKKKKQRQDALGSILDYDSLSGGSYATLEEQAGSILEPPSMTQRRPSPYRDSGPRLVDILDLGNRQSRRDRRKDRPLDIMPINLSKPKLDIFSGLQPKTKSGTGLSLVPSTIQDTLPRLNIETIPGIDTTTKQRTRQRTRLITDTITDFDFPFFPRITEKTTLFDEFFPRGKGKIPFILPGGGGYDNKGGGRGRKSFTLISVNPEKIGVIEQAGVDPYMTSYSPSIFDIGEKKVIRAGRRQKKKGKGILLGNELSIKGAVNESSIRAGRKFNKPVNIPLGRAPGSGINIRGIGQSRPQRQQKPGRMLGANYLNKKIRI